jgi:hypothetical protein
MSLSLKKIVVALCGIFFVTALAACSPEVGSKEWCEDLKEKPKGDWSSNEAAEFAKNCVF